MTTHYLYIIYSKNKDRYYVGSTSDDLESRIRRHNSNHTGYTGKVSDWRLVYTEEFDDKISALQMEKQIKKWKSRKIITNFLFAKPPKNIFVGSN
ncbi:MAG: excinuclease ABC subunit C [Marinilabiliales bacterium]|nr:MAG: excinuclease ABC subunit C [Marinilabiliales bacterium]